MTKKQEPYKTKVKVVLLQEDGTYTLETHEYLVMSHQINGEPAKFLRTLSKERFRRARKGEKANVYTTDGKTFEKIGLVKLDP